MNIPKTQRLSPNVKYPFGFRGVVFSVMAMGLAAAMVTAFTGAVFTDTATSTGNSFTAGAALDIKLTDSNESLLNDVTASLTSSSMLPGDTVSGIIKVKNTNTYSVRFAVSGALSNLPASLTISGSSTVASPTEITTTGSHGLITGDYVVISGATGYTPTINGTFQVTKTGAATFTIPVAVTVAGSGGTVAPKLTTFGQALTIDVWRQATGSPAVDPGDCSAASPTGTQIVTASAFAANDGSSTNLIGNPAQGAQSGDISLTGGQDTILCFQVKLPLSTGNSVAGQAQETTWTFAAEQTANNP